MTAKPIYKRVLLKASGEALMGSQGFGIDVAVADRIVLLREGVIQLQGPRDEVLAAMRPDPNRESPGGEPGGPAAQPRMAPA